MMTMRDYLENKGPLFFISLALFSVATIGAADFLTGSEISLSLFYLLPIALTTWFLGRNCGLGMSLVCAVTIFAAASFSHHSDRYSGILYWRALMHLGFFISFSILLPALKALEHEKVAARVDFLTGISNRRHFFEVADIELVRSKKQKTPLTVAFFDLDGFKAVNDLYGHAVGDKLLCAVVERAKNHLRRTDIFARLGGDEFVLLLPDTSQKAAEVIVPRIHSALSDEMKKNGWPVTFSLGVLTCQDASATIDELIKTADELMYSVKNKGKDAIAYEAYKK